MRKIKITILSLLMLLWGGFILYNSNQGYTASNNRSNHIVDKIKEEIPKRDTNNNDKNNVTNQKLNLLVRKSAHFFQYLVYAIIVILLLEQLNLKSREEIIYTLFIILLFSTCDEFYQIFIDGRTSSIRDVLIDFCGGISGIIFLKVIELLISKIKNRIVIIGQ